MNFSDSIEKTVDGALLVKPMDRHGQLLRDPYSVFRNPDGVRYFNEHAERIPEMADHILLGSNLVVDLGRQTLAYLAGGRDYTATTAANNWVITKGSWGTHDEVPRFTDSSLSPQAGVGVTAGANEIEYQPGLKHKPIFSVDWPQPFIVRFEIVLDAAEGNGYLLREMGLWTQNDTLFARKVFPAIEKNDTFALGFLWRLRF